ncbi:hypothetical protein [Flavobacterium sp.]|uniref:hypothetical protein n=1 Tax=Flavobacterium sp. TaxID=239 RepID=UPI00286D97B3|nr:hypothetical protein [Flavobacterium sp.]
MINLVNEAFPHIETCLSKISDKHSYVFEDNELKKGVFVTINQPRHLHIENRISTDFYFIQNDDCIMNNFKGGQCDYVIFNSNKFHFIEVKVAKGSLLNKKTKTKAYDQIANTFKYYSKRIVFSDEVFLIGLICVSKSSRIIQPSKSTKRKEFKEKYKIDLQEGNYILFE